MPLRRIAACVIMLLALAGAASRPACAGAAPAVIRIAGGATYVDGATQLSGITAIVAKQGWLETELAKRGVKLEWFPVSHAQTGPLINEAFATGEIQFAAYGDLPALILTASGTELRVLIPNGESSPMDTFLVVPADSAARSIEDLKGKRIAVHRGRPWEVPFLRLLDAHHLSYADFQIYNIDPTAGAAAVATGGVDALYTMTDAYMLEERHVGRIIWSTATAPADWKMRTEFWGSADFVAQHPDLTQLVVTAFIKARYWAAQPQNRAAALAGFARPGMSPAILARIYNGDDATWRARWSPDFDQVVRDHYRHTASYAYERKMIARPVDTDRLFDPRFSETALNQLGIARFWSGATPDAVAAAEPFKPAAVHP
jgi:sulfonate transport system substrate-binding protein